MAPVLLVTVERGSHIWKSTEVQENLIQLGKSVENYICKNMTFMCRTEAVVYRALNIVPA